MRYVVSHGGPGPIPASDEAKAKGCTCLGQIDDLDRWGRLGGFTVDNQCPIHGKEARRRVNRQARLDWMRTMKNLEASP